MRFLPIISSILLALSDAQYQLDAPSGRWYGSEQSPKHKRTPPPDAIIGCPSDMNFCLDYKWSDARTCLHPNPHLIKRCLDLGCIESPFGQSRALSLLEDTYCKDFMSREGRYCQWTEQFMCNCPSHIEDVVYANGVVVMPGDAMPEGYRKAEPCIYPTGNMKRMPNGAYVDIPVPGEPLPPPMPDDAKLKGNLSWVDPRGESNDATLRPLPGFSSTDGNNDASLMYSNGYYVSIVGITAAVLMRV